MDNSVPHPADCPPRNVGTLCLECLRESIRCLSELGYEVLGGSAYHPVVIETLFAEQYELVRVVQAHPNLGERLGQTKIGCVDCMGRA